MKNSSLVLCLALFLSGFQTMPPAKDVAAASTAKHRLKVILTQGNEGCVTVKSAHRATISFYLFDVDSKLIFQTVLRQSDQELITGLTKGTYSYTAFENDKSIDEATINIR